MNRKLAANVVVAAASILTLMSAAMKLTQAPMAMEMFARYGLNQYLVAIGLLEFAIACIFIVPTTRRIGFALANGYFGGAIAIDLAATGMPLAPLMVLALYWIAMHMTDKEALISPAHYHHVKHQHHRK